MVERLAIRNARNIERSLNQARGAILFSRQLAFLQAELLPIGFNVRRSNTVDPSLLKQCMGGPMIQADVKKERDGGIGAEMIWREPQRPPSPMRLALLDRELNRS